MDSKQDYFIKRTDSRLEAIEKKIDALLAIKFMLLGGSAVVSFVVNLIFLIFETKH